MKFIYQSDDLKYYLFYSKETGKNMLNVYTLKKKGHQYYFDFIREIKSVKNDYHYENFDDPSADFYFD